MRRFPLVVSAVFGLTLGLGSLPADASEVVKLARLVITGKRLSPERLEPVAMRRTDAPTATAQAALPGHSAPAPAPTQTQTQTQTAAVSPIASGQDTQARNIAAPSRGVLSFF